MYTPHLHAQEILERCSLWYELGQGRCGVQLYFGASEFHHLVVNSVGAIQIQQTKKSSPLTEKGEPPSLETKTRGQLLENPGTCLRVYNNKSKPRGIRALSFPSFPHPEPFHLQYINMSGASVLAGAHHFVAHDNMFIAANTVSRMVMV